MAQAKPTVYEFIPKLGQLRDDVLFGDVWEHPDLSKRDRSLITVAMLAALYRTDEMRGHMQRALDNGVTETELKGLITHVAFYAGWPCAVNAGRVAIDVFGPKIGSPRTLPGPAPSAFAGAAISRSGTARQRVRDGLGERRPGAPRPAQTIEHDLAVSAGRRTRT